MLNLSMKLGKNTREINAKVNNNVQQCCACGTVQTTVRALSIYSKGGNVISPVCIVDCKYLLWCDIRRRYFALSQSRYCDVDEGQLKKSMEELTDKFTEARELMEDARESKGTVYFSDDVIDAKSAVEETLTEYQTLLNKISDSQKQQVMRTIGLRMEELKAQLTAMEDELKED
ncbi:hypothetical protein SNE40_019395 [Patella caerulea]